MVCVVEGEKINKNVGLKYNDMMALYARDQGLMGMSEFHFSAHLCLTLMFMQTKRRKMKKVGEDETPLG